jgi:hypothetical protein
VLALGFIPDNDADEGMEASGREDMALGGRRDEMEGLLSFLVNSATQLCVRT